MASNCGGGGGERVRVGEGRIGVRVREGVGDAVGVTEVAQFGCLGVPLIGLPFASSPQTTAVGGPGFVIQAVSLSWIWPRRSRLPNVLVFLCHATPLLFAVSTRRFDESSKCRISPKLPRSPV